MLLTHTRIYITDNCLTTCVKDILMKRRQNQRKMLTILILTQKREKILLPNNGLQTHSHAVKARKVTEVPSVVAMAEEVITQIKIAGVFPPIEVGKIKENQKDIKVTKEEKAKVLKANIPKAKILIRNVSTVEKWAT